MPHRRLGADVGAAVVLRPDAKVSGQKLRVFARERVASFKVPGVIRIVSEIPNGSGAPSIMTVMPLRTPWSISGWD